MIHISKLASAYLLELVNSTQAKIVYGWFQHSGVQHDFMMSSSNGNIFHLTGPLCGEFTGHWWIPSQRPVTRSFDVFYDQHLNKWLSKQSIQRWFEMPSPSLWHCNIVRSCPTITQPIISEIITTNANNKTPILCLSGQDMCVFLNLKSYQYCTVVIFVQYATLCYISVLL